jgi:hypothetical protein
MKSNKFLLPMHLQYLVGLCCLRSHPEAVDLTLGDMVRDDSTGQYRDVDVTITVDIAGAKHAFKAYEVKDEGRRLDVTKVEQLCAKLLDMKSATHRAIVSTSGFTEPAMRKAAAHAVELYVLQPAKKHGLFPAELKGRRGLLCWKEWSLRLIVPHSSLHLESAGVPVRSDGTPHVLADFAERLLLRSTGALVQHELASTALNNLVAEDDMLREGWRGEAWPFVYAVDVTQDDVHVSVQGSLLRVASVEITGKLQWKVDNERSAAFELTRVSDGTAMAGAHISLGASDEQLFALVSVPGSSTMDVRIVHLTPEQLAFIHKLRLVTN